MAKQTKHLITKRLLKISDVKAVVLTCTRCKSDVILTVAGSTRVPLSCPACSDEWNLKGPPTGCDNVVGDYMSRHRSLPGANRRVSNDATPPTLGEATALNRGYTMSLEVDIKEPSRGTDRVDTLAPDGA